MAANAAAAKTKATNMRGNEKGASMENICAEGPVLLVRRTA
jgi:hypothetical protein